MFNEIPLTNTIRKFLKISYNSKRICIYFHLMKGYLSPVSTPGNLRSHAARPSTVAWDKHSPVKTVGMATNVLSSQASPALVNALFERVEEQAEVSEICRVLVNQLELESYLMYVV